MQLKKACNFGFSLRAILIHSLWITILGITLLRLATANTQELLYVNIFCISGAILATSPWIIQFLISTMIIILYKASICDLTGLMRPASEEVPCCQGSRTVDEYIEGALQIRNGDIHGRVNGYRGDGFTNGASMCLQVNGRSGPQLQRNRTV
ncbi:hypothetical protein CFOL_v3_05610 [Cephalotus follicularis]|uniref:Uncharacterized protein n=1 Tax=Cephalotus follicularis TaxID=3775 RepID=A0A1Q3B242_CEPFO|nr:hypothetical protein CFOL_v3_05610 [Cephalotus follicularis]